jgi:hypothetical protein
MNVTLKNCRFSYLNVLTPREQKNDNGDVTYRYSANLLVPKDSADHKALQAAIEAVAVGAWANKAQGVLAKLYSDNRVCLKDGDKELDKDGTVRSGYEGQMSLRSSAAQDSPPRAFNKFGEKITNDTKHEFTGERCGPYSGAYGEAMVRLWAQDNQDPKIGRRINCQLIAIKMSAAGDSLARKEMSDDEILSQFSVQERKEPSLEEMAS